MHHFDGMLGDGTKQPFPPSFQEILTGQLGPDPFEVMDLSRADFVQGKGILDKSMPVSHRWVNPGDPGPDGKQLKAIQAHLKKNLRIECVWID